MEVFQGAVELAASQSSQAPAIVVDRIFRIEADGPVVLLDRTFKIPRDRVKGGGSEKRASLFISAVRTFGSCPSNAASPAVGRQAETIS